MGSLKIPLLFFLITLFTFHGFIYLKWTKKRFWIIIDYFWVSLGFLGIISANRDIRTLLNQNSISSSKQNINWQYKAALENSKEFHAFYDPKTTGFQYNIFQDTSLVTAYISAGVWYGNLTDTLTKYKNAILNHDSLVVVKSIKNYTDSFPFLKKKSAPEMSGVHEIVAMYINNIDKEADSINKITGDEQNNDWEMFLKFLSPILIAIAIAIRLSKVTAQLKGIA